MKKLISSTIKKFSYYTIVIMLISYAIQLWVPAIKIASVWPFILIFLYVFTLFVTILLTKFVSSKISSFANAYMLANFSKLVLFSIIIVVYALLNRSQAISFTITFFVYYLLLTTYEVFELLNLQKNLKK